MKNESYTRFTKEDTRAQEVKWLVQGHSQEQDLNPDPFFSTMSHCFPNKLWLGNWNTWASSGHDSWDTIVGEGSILEAKAFLTDLHLHLPLENERCVLRVCTHISTSIIDYSPKYSAWITRRPKFLSQGNANSVQTYGSEIAPPTSVALGSKLIA